MYAIINIPVSIRGWRQSFLALVFLLLTLPCMAEYKDHPLLARYEGANIYDSTSSKFIEYPIAKGAIDKAGNLNKKIVSGKYSHIHYQIPGSDGVALVVNSYIQSLKNKGFSMTFVCKQMQCGGDIVKKLFYGTPLMSGYNYVIGGFDESLPDDFAYVVAHSKSEAREIYVILSVKQVLSIAADIDLVQDIIEIDNLIAKKVDINLDFVSGIRDDGKVVLDGLFFEHDGTELKQSSRDALHKIADYLKSSQDTQFYVVGHTDGVGKYGYNLKLSKARAASVVRALNEDYKIKSGRLIPIGVGPVSPVSTNKAESGRAQNRRVELVLK